MPVSGRVLVASLESDSNILASELVDAKANLEVQEIAFRGTDFDQTVTTALANLLLQENRVWKNVELINCTGEVKEVVASIVATGCLQELHLIRNIEVFDGYGALGRALAATTSLKKLRLTAALSESCANLLSKGLIANTSLEHVEFRWSTFEARSIGRIAEGLAENKHLRSLDFFGCALEDDDLCLLFSALRHHPMIESFMFTGNKCSGEAARVLAALIASDGCTLQKLDLSFQRLDEGKTLSIGPLMQAVSTNISLRTLDLTCNRLDDEDAERIATSMHVNHTLRELFLARNEFTDKGIKAIARSLPMMEGLKKLSLWGNPFGEEGARELLNGMARNMELFDLHLFRKFKVSEQIQYFTNMNRGGRRLLQEPPNQVPTSLWSLVLERANTMKLPTRRTEDDNQKARVDMIYCLIRGPVLLSRGLYLAIQLPP